MSDKREDHNELIAKEFSKQVNYFDQPGTNLCREDIMDWIVDRLPLHPEMVVLDVASGTGILARGMTRFVKHVTALDYTQEMLDKGKSIAARDQITNIEFIQGDAEKLPFAADSFRLVTCRYAFHHFEEYSLKMNEMMRVCQENGWVAVCDIVTENPEMYEKYNHFERLRDPSHTYCLTHEKLQNLFIDSGLLIVRNESRDLSVEFETWYNMGSMSDNLEVKNTIINALENELKGGEKTGMRPYMKDGKLHFLQAINIIVGKKH
ncbi:MAG: methyltransferase domain-containing protein [Lentisphaerae bacterium]|nr:methyltransferase domain-containing protein [Lentisphaerota bacterium]MCP4102576.1 methyltransferase domain-containing protein [Lentisphaerota bacterium]